MIIETRLNQMGVYEMKHSLWQDTSWSEVSTSVVKHSLKYGRLGAFMFAVSLIVTWAFAPTFFGMAIITGGAMATVWMVTVAIIVAAMGLDYTAYRLMKHSSKNVTEIKGEGDAKETAAN